MSQIIFINIFDEIEKKHEYINTKLLRKNVKIKNSQKFTVIAFQDPELWFTEISNIAKIIVFFYNFAKIVCFSEFFFANIPESKMQWSLVLISKYSCNQCCGSRQFWTGSGFKNSGCGSCSVLTKTLLLENLVMIFGSFWVIFCSFRIRICFLRIWIRIRVAKKSGSATLLATPSNDLINLLQSMIC